VFSGAAPRSVRASRARSHDVCGATHAEFRVNCIGGISRAFDIPSIAEYSAIATPNTTLRHPVHASTEDITSRTILSV
jgi:hypothetical protein